MRKKSALVAALAIPVLGVAMIGCAQTGGSDASESGETSELVFAGWGGIVNEAMYEAEFDPFTADTGISVVDDSPLSLVKLQSMVKSDNVTWDLMMANPVETSRYCGELYEPLDLPDVNPDDFVEGSVTECGIPHNYYSTAMVYNTDVFGDNPPTTLEDFFDTEKYPGKRLFPSDALEHALEFALVADGVAPEDLYPLDIDRALAKLDTVKDELVFWALGDEQTQAMEAESAPLGIVWTGRGLQSAENGAPYEVVWGTHIIGTTQLAIPKGTKNLQAAQDLIQFAVSPEPQAQMNELLAYSAANLKAEPELTDIQKHWDPLFGGESVEPAFMQDYDYWAENLEDIQTAYSNWSIG